MSQTDRHYQYKQILSARRAVTSVELMERLEISKATLKRDLEFLRSRMNVPVIYDAELGGYRLDSSAEVEELPGLYLSQDEMLALMTIQNMLSQLEPGILGPKLKPMQKRLDEMLKRQGMSAEALAQRMLMVHAGKRLLPIKSYEAVAQATLDRLKLKIAHLNRQDGKTTRRVISPQQMVYYRDNWYVDGWCHLRKGLRRFSIDAITRAEVVQEPALEVDLTEVRQTLQSGYGIFGGEVKGKARMTFSAERARWVQSEQWHPQQQFTANADGSYTLEVPFTDERELLGDILRFGCHVKVHSPASLVQAVKEQLKLALKGY